MLGTQLKASVKMLTPDESQIQAAIEDAWNDVVLVCDEDNDEDSPSQETETMLQVVPLTEHVPVKDQFRYSLDLLGQHLSRAVEQIAKETGLKKVSISVGFHVEPFLHVTVE